MKVSGFLVSLLIGASSAAPVADQDQSAAAQKAAFIRSLNRRQSTPLNAFLSGVVALFPVNVAVSGLSGLITVGEQGLADTFHIDTTEDGLGGSCGAMTIIFARGTTEAGNVGALVGPPFFDAVQKRLGGSASLVIQGVDYPADVPGFLAGGSAAGSQQMADDVNQALQACPNTKVVMSGYSQGGQLVHNAAKILGSTMSKVSSVVIFGDPLNGDAVVGAPAGKTLVICHEGDNICERGDLILVPHLTYGNDADQAAAFVISNAGAISS